ncbi:hypothetical protein IIC68_03895, partial [archaeon]|nr:hypothetical protein [archaeon]
FNDDIIVDGVVFTQDNGVSSDPLFTDPGNSDYTLQSGSPAIDAGVNLSAFIGNLDIIGVSRPQVGAWDIGAYESG